MNRKKAAAVLLVLMLSGPAAGRASIFGCLASLEKSKYVHFSAGVIISHVSYPVIKKYFSEENAWLYSFLLAVAAGAAKEIYDIPRTGFDWADLAATSLGGLTIAAVEF